MAYEEALKTMTFEAAADLSDLQFRIVKLTGEREVNKATGSSDNLLGILQGEPESGESAEVAVGGISKIEFASDVSVGDWITSDSDGKGEKIDHGNATDTLSDMRKMVGQVVVAASSDEFGSVEINRQIVAG